MPSATFADGTDHVGKRAGLPADVVGRRVHSLSYTACCIRNQAPCPISVDQSVCLNSDIHCRQMCVLQLHTAVEQCRSMHAARMFNTCFRNAPPTAAYSFCPTACMNISVSSAVCAAALLQVEAASEQVREKVAQVAKDWEVPPAEVPSNTEDIIRSRQQQQ